MKQEHTDTIAKSEIVGPGIYALVWKGKEILTVSIEEEDVVANHPNWVKILPDGRNEFYFQGNSFEDVSVIPYE
jgi:hypothetical protein